MFRFPTSETVCVSVCVHPFDFFFSFLCVSFFVFVILYAVYLWEC